MLEGLKLAVFRRLRPYVDERYDASAPYACTNCGGPLLRQTLYCRKCRKDPDRKAPCVQ